jgi:integrase
MVNPSGSVIAYNNFVARNLKRINTNFVAEHRFHDTRHTFASLGTQVGVPELYMQKLMGHTPSSILYTTYTHISMEELHKYINMIQ